MMENNSYYLWYIVQPIELLDDKLEEMDQGSKFD